MDEPEGLPEAPRASKPWMRLTVFFVAVTLASTAGMGTGALLAQEPPAPEPIPMTIYITDAPARLSALDVKIASVSVGPGKAPLRVMQSSFDLAALQGPDAAILLAQGDVPADAMGTVEVTFASARATIDNHSFDLPLDQSLVVRGMEAPSLSDPAFLIDVHLPSSLAVDADGQLRFAPVAGAVLAGPDPISGAARWSPLEDVEMDLPDLEPAGIAAPSGHDWASRDVPLAPSNSSVGADGAANATAGDGVGLDGASLPGWFVVFEDENMSSLDMRAAVEAHEGVYVTSLQSLPAAYFMATERQARLLGDRPDVEWVEAEVPIQYHDAESRQAIQLPALTDPVAGLRDAQGRPIDGRGIGVAVVDTGIDGTHPAFQRTGLVGDSVVGDNRKVVSKAFVPLPNTDTTSGHGTHVAAILAGQGSSDEALPGVAPGVTLYGLGVGDGKSILWAAQAFDWIIQNHDEVDPPIRVVTNSWGSEGAYDANTVTTRLVNRMVSQGIVVVFSASNEAGDGSEALTSAQCQIPRPGVICVAAYDDLGTGTRDGKIAPYSSRGHQSQPSTWPDLSAPGTEVRSARTLAGYETGVGVYRYVELSGTSQAAPHVAGVAAMMLQMDPSLKPDDIEAHLKETAYPFADGGHYSRHGHYAKGHGLLDAYAAVAAVG